MQSTYLVRRFLGILLALAHPLAAQTRPPTAAVPPPSKTAAAGVRFTEVTAAAGLSRFRFVSGTAAKDYIIEATGSGCAFLDYDNDGWLDIYLVNGSTMEALAGRASAPRASLYRNNRDGTFTDVTEKAGVANEAWGQGVCAGDYDNDGWTDIYVTNFGPNRLYRNNGDGTFSDQAVKAGASIGGWSAGCAFGDYDGDGRLDLFVAGYVRFDPENPPPPATPPATAGIESKEVKTGEKEEKGEKGEKGAAVGMGASYSAGMAHCLYRGQRVMCGPRGLKGERDYLLRNNGDGTFSDTSERAGVADEARYFGLGVAWLDYDDDGRLDLFVANDSTPNYLYRNKGDGTFEDVSFISGTALDESGREQACMGVAVGDYDLDGRVDLHVTNFSDDLNTLYHNDDGQNFSETTRAVGFGLTFPFLGWGTNFFDYDNDGWPDLLVANGHLYPQVDEPSWGTSYKQRLLLFRNLRGRSFDEVGSSAGAALYHLRSARASSIGDFDNDGDLDILLSNMDDAPGLLRNDGANKAGHYLTIRLIGDPSRRCPRDAIGTTVFCTVGGKRLRAEVASGRSFYAQSDLRVHFGLGSATRIDKLEVRWANGRAEEYRITGVDRLVTIEQGKGIMKM